MIFVQFGCRAAAMWQRGEITTLAFLARELVDKGLVDVEQSGKLANGSDAALRSVNDSFTKV